MVPYTPIQNSPLFLWVHLQVSSSGMLAHLLSTAKQFLFKPIAASNPVPKKKIKEDAHHDLLITHLLHLGVGLQLLSTFAIFFSTLICQLTSY